DLLPLALQRTLGREDLLREMLGHVCLGRGEPRCRLTLSGQRLPAGSAELSPRRHGRTARRAGDIESGAALLAEADIGAIVEATLRAEHSADLLQFSFGLLQPEVHVHPAVHRSGDVEVLLCLVALTGLPIEPAEAEMAVGDGRPHAQLGPEIRR